MKGEITGNEDLVIDAFGVTQVPSALAEYFHRGLDGAALLNRRQKQNLVSHFQKQSKSA